MSAGVCYQYRNKEIKGKLKNLKFSILVNHNITKLVVLVIHY